MNDNDTEVSVKEFFLDLSANQEDLGDDFKRVLYENLWELYEE